MLGPLRLQRVLPPTLNCDRNIVVVPAEREEPGPILRSLSLVMWL
jgi:hypothetical protein